MRLIESRTELNCSVANLDFLVWAQVIGKIDRKIKTQRHDLMFFLTQTVCLSVWSSLKKKRKKKRIPIHLSLTQNKAQ